MVEVAHCGAVLEPSDTMACQDCPLGASCNGSHLEPRIKGSTWARVGQTLRIAQCPVGYIVVRFHLLLAPVACILAVEHFKFLPALKTACIGFFFLEFLAVMSAP